ncbi:MAG: RNA-protein complex protein Nop10 [Nanoarchaeota archaeon]|nr:RNA-protein complex protein Nop10 [Nanoarchaeota archaeon]
MRHLLKCKQCHEYTLHDSCPKCGGEAISPIPPKYSPEDPYGSYRRKAKREMLEKEGVL